MTDQIKTTPRVYDAILMVAKAIGAEGISKDRKNESQGYRFRGIDDVYAALSRHLVTAGLCILPRVLHVEYEAMQTQKGGTLNYCRMRVAFDFVATSDGSSHTIEMAGEAMDSGDKATNKAMSAAYKYACFQAFCIPTEGDNDADGTTHEPAAKPAKAATPAKVKVEPFATPAEAAKAISETTTPAALHLVGTRIAASNFLAEERANLRELAGEKLAKMEHD